MKFGKAPGFDGIHSEFGIHCGKYAREWLAQTKYFHKHSSSHQGNKRNLKRVERRPDLQTSACNTLPELTNNIINNRPFQVILVNSHQTNETQ